MSRLDLIIFGATGFTGKHAVAEMVRMAEDFPGITWGIAGRSKKKLESLLVNVATKTGADLSQVKIIVANIDYDETLRAMCSQAKVLVNCCGPYRYLGEPVVKAAIESKTHHVDVNGEPQFMELMQLKYDQLAREAGVFVISACGFDSIPADLGVRFLQQNFGGTLHSVEAFLSFKFTTPGLWMKILQGGSIHYGTWESFVYGLANKNELPAIRMKLFPTQLEVFKPKLEQKWVHRRGGSWCVPLFTSDSSVVFRTQRRLHQLEGIRPAQFRLYLQSSWLSTALVMLMGLLIVFMSSYQFTRRLLLEYPRLFTFGTVSLSGPSELVMNSTQFQFELEGHGWEGAADENAAPNKRMSAKVTGVNPGYGATVVALLLSAVTIIKERELMPAAGGVLTTGIAFPNTTIIENLNKRNLKFELQQ